MASELPDVVNRKDFHTWTGVVFTRAGNFYRGTKAWKTGAGPTEPRSIGACWQCGTSAGRAHQNQRALGERRINKNGRAGQRQPKVHVVQK